MAERPPLSFWLIPTVVATLRMLPFVSLGFTAPPPGETFLGVTYLPKDFLQYAALSRQVAVDGSFLLYNPFTTEPQSPRFILLFHWLVGLVARVTGASTIDVFEWSRVPLVFLFFATLWWFLRPVLDDRRDRLTAALLAGFAGGLDGWLRLFGGAWLSKEFDVQVQYATWELHGWSVYAGFYNPLWTAGLTLVLLVLRPLLFSARASPRGLALAGVAFTALFFVHPYSALGTLAVTAAWPVLTLACGERVDWRRQLANALVLGVALAVIGAISLWQLQDPVYRRSTGGVFGPQNLSGLWYPLTLGVLGVMAVAGARRWIATCHPARAAILGWIAAIALLHWPPLLNGYKFVFLLPLPVCILAAPVAREWLARIRGPGWRRRALGLAAALALFGGCALQTVSAVRSAASVGAVASDLMRVVAELAARPPGNVLAPTGLGNVLPAFTSDRVWVGHWFLTPDYSARASLYQRFTTNGAAADQLRAVLREQRIRYLVVSSGRADFVTKQLGGQVAERRRHGELETLVLQ